MTPSDQPIAVLADCDGECTAEAIAIRAYRIYVARGPTEGHDLRDWLEAEAQLLAEQQSRGNRPAYSL